MQLIEDNSLDRLTKEKVLELLNIQGYHTYAERLQNFDFYVADFYDGALCQTAFVNAADGYICINPGFIVDMTTDGPIFQQLSVIVRHELLHALLCHEKRFFDYLKETDPDFEKNYQRADLHTLANFAMDYDLGNVGYDDYDKEVVRNMTLNGQVIGGLLAEQVTGGKTAVYGAGIHGNGPHGAEIYMGDQFNNWENLTMEEMFALLRTEHDKFVQSHKEQSQAQKTTLHVKKATHSQEYRDIYNQIIKKYGQDTSLTPSDIQDLMTRAANGEDILS